MSAYRQTGVMPEQLEPVEVPDCAIHIWGWFAKLSPKRLMGMGIGPISSLEIEAWCRLHAVSMSPFEVLAIEAIDAVYVASSNKEKKK